MVINRPIARFNLSTFPENVTPMIIPRMIAEVYVLFEIKNPRNIAEIIEEMYDGDMRSFSP
jgi:hypothetical protein